MSVLYVVGTPIGNLGDFTPRAVETLKSAALVACEDTRVTAGLFAKFFISTPLISYHKFNEKARAETLRKKFSDPDFKMALVTDAGTPAVSDPGAILVATARDAGAEILVVPGASAAVSALSVSGFLGDKFCFMGFFPRKDSDRAAVLETVKGAFPANYIFYETGQRLAVCLRSIVKNLGGDTLVAVSKELTKMFEKTRVGNAEDMLAGIKTDAYAGKGEYVVIISKPERAYPPHTAADTLTGSAASALETLIVQTALDNSLSIKDTVNLLSKTHKKKDLYNASLRVKDLFLLPFVHKR